MKFDVFNRWSGQVQFSAEIECGEDAPPRVKVGLAIKWAYSSGADLRGADLRGADLRGADLRGADLRGAVLSGADLRVADLRDADLRGADLRGADLRGADLRGAVLSGADLRVADLRDAVLRGADLRGADLRDAHLRGAVLSGADLRGADLSGADLRDADLRDAVLRDAVLREYRVDGIVDIIDAGSPNHWAAFGYVDRDSQSLRVHVGCRRFEVGEGRAYWSKAEHPELLNRREVLAALDYIEAVARLRGWSGPRDA